MTGRGREDGAILVLVLLIVTVMSLTGVAVAQLAVDSHRDAPVLGDAGQVKARLVNALDSGIRAETEDLRANLQAGTPALCSTSPLTILNADPLPPGSTTSLKVDVTLASCTAPSGPVELDATVTECSAGSCQAALAEPTVDAVVSFSSVGGQWIPATVSWKQTGGG